MISDTFDYKCYILNDENMLNYLKYKLNNYKLNNDDDRNSNQVYKKERKTNNTKNYDLFIPRENDSLFWCYYIILNN
jgi:hypothetical protein